MHGGGWPPGVSPGTVKTIAAALSIGAGASIGPEDPSVQIGGQGWEIAGSLNGGEVSAKSNREMALLVGSNEVYDYLARVS
jgi:H+/Cl- antiporter ClcA